MHVYEIRPRKDKRGVDLICDVLPFGGLWYSEPMYRFPYQQDQALRSATVWQRIGRLGSSYDDHAADGAASLAGHKVRAVVRGEGPSSASVPARSADNGPGIHMAKTIAVIA